MKGITRKRGWTLSLSMAGAFLGFAIAGGETEMKQEDKEIRWKTADIHEVDRAREEGCVRSRVRK